MKHFAMAILLLLGSSSCSNDGNSPSVGLGGDGGGDSAKNPHLLADGAVINYDVHEPQTCMSDRDCPSDICLQELAVGICAEPCDAQGGCYKQDWGCFPIYSDAGPTQPLCLPHVSVLCMPCSGDVDCSTLDGSFSGRCLQLATEGSFCGFSCIAHTDCPDGYTCKAFDFGDGLAGQCQPKIEQCVCNEIGKRTVWTVECDIENEFGACPGTNQCPPAGSATCTAQVPLEDVCNGLDDNCDGEVDNSSNIGEDCGESNKGICKLGTIACTDGEESCEGAVLPTDEVCDGLDNDCDWAVDDDYPEHLQPCGDTTGECKAGKYLCQNGSLVCVDPVGPSDEKCDGKDNDCNGVVDNDIPGLGEVCGSEVGECNLGETDCKNGKLVCAGETVPAEEICNGKDDDCDGTVDFPDCEL